MRKWKVLVLILYSIILLYLAYQAYQVWETSLITVLMLIALWLAGVGTLSRLFDWLLHENTELKVTNKENEGQNEKRIVSGRLLSEINRNQKLLKPLYDTSSKVLECNDNLSNLSDNNKLPNDLKFNRSIYSVLSDKIGLLTDASREMIDHYYPELGDIENEYEKLEIIHGASDSFLGYLIIDSEFNIKYRKHDDNSPGKYEMEEFLRHIIEIYDLGQDLKISLED